jgi:hypothetical protein
MNDVAAGSANKNTQGRETARPSAGESTALDCRYGQIGISAVAAAARYQGGTKNPAYAPSPMNWQDQPGEAA